MPITIDQHGILHFLAEDQRQLSLTFCRMQEFYESQDPSIRGQYFTFEKFLSHYIASDGNCPYFSSWVGFNFPRSTLSEFMSAFQGHLSLAERSLIQLILTEEWDRKAPVQYIIGTTADARPSDRLHEQAHGLWHCVPAYREAMEEALAALPDAFANTFANILYSSGYPADVLQDEIQAYLASSPAFELASIYPGDHATAFWTHCPTFSSILKDHLQ